MNADIADIAHARGALVGYVHPFDDYPEPIAKPHEALTNELPVDVALGKVDYMEIIGFSDHRATAARLVSALESGVSDSGSGRYGCHGELRVAARARRHEPRVCRASPTARSKPAGMAGGAEGAGAALRPTVLCWDSLWAARKSVTI